MTMQVARLALALRGIAQSASVLACPIAPTPLSQRAIAAERKGDWQSADIIVVGDGAPASRQDGFVGYVHPRRMIRGQRSNRYRVVIVAQTPCDSGPGAMARLAGATYLLKRSLLRPIFPPVEPGYVPLRVEAAK